MGELPAPIGVAGHDLTVPLEDIFAAGQSLQADGSPGVDLARGDSHLRTQTVAETVGEAGGAVPHHRAGIHVGEELPGRGFTAGNNAAGTRARKALQEVGRLVKTRRGEITEEKNVRKEAKG